MKVVLCCSLSGEYQMTATRSCPVRVHFVERKFISFDFSLFAIVIKNPKSIRDGSYVYMDQFSYRNKFMAYWYPDKKDFLVELIAISVDEFKKIKEAGQKWVEKWEESDIKQLFHLLRKNFPRQVKLYYK